MTNPVAPRVPRDGLTIPQIQGHGALSPYNGKTVATQGVITAIQDIAKTPGVWIQDLKGDGDNATSDGVFVNTTALTPAARDKLTVGQTITVTGEVAEPNDVTTIMSDAKGIQAVRGVRKLTPDQLPAPAELHLPHDAGTRSAYLEAREGMLTTLPNAIAMSPTTRFGSFGVTDESVHGPQRDFGDDNETGRIAVSERIGPHTQFTTGDRIGGIAGPLDWDYDDYAILQKGYFTNVKRSQYPPQMWGDIDNDDRITPTDITVLKNRIGTPANGPLDPADLNADGKITTADTRAASARMKLDTGKPGFSIATMNAENFFDDADAPAPVDDDVVSTNVYQAKLARLAGAIRDRLHYPDMVAMQEVENTHVLDDLVSRPELKDLGYKYVLLPTNGHRSINPVLLYRADHVDVSNPRQLNTKMPASKAPLADPGADGTDPAEEPLFAREPLVMDVSVKGEDAGQQQDFTLIVNHLISKFSPHGLPTDPIRIEQAKYLNRFVQDLTAKDPGRQVVVVGDMNDTPDSKAIKALAGPAKSPTLVSVVSEVPKGEQYTFNFGGRCDVIDQIMTTPDLAAQLQRVGVRHFDSDIPEAEGYGSAPLRATDHDPPYAVFSFPGASAAQQAVAGAAGAGAVKVKQG